MGFRCGAPGGVLSRPFIGERSGLLPLVENPLNYSSVVQCSEERTQECFYHSLTHSLTGTFFTSISLSVPFPPHTLTLPIEADGAEEHQDRSHRAPPRAALRRRSLQPSGKGQQEASSGGTTRQEVRTHCGHH